MCTNNPVFSTARLLGPLDIQYHLHIDRYLRLLGPLDIQYRLHIDHSLKNKIIPRIKLWDNNPGIETGRHKEKK